MAIETPPVTPVAPPPPSDRASKLEAVLKAKPLPPEQQQALRELFSAGDANNTKIRSALDPLPIDNDSKNQIWKAYYSVDHPAPPPPKVKAPVLPQPPAPPVMLRENQPYMKQLTPAPLPPPPVPAGVKEAAEAARFDTKLSTEDETKFQSWKQQYAPKDSGQDYDLRGAFKAGLTPNPATGHWTDTFKKPNHPTFSVESQYAKDAPEKAGHWEGDTFVPPGGAVNRPPSAAEPPSAMVRENQPYMSHTTPAPLPPPPVPFKTEFPGIPPSRPQGPLPVPQVGIGDVIKGLPKALSTIRDENQKKTTWEAFRDTVGTTVKGAGGLLQAASAGYYEPEKGAITLPMRLLNELTFQPKLVKTEKGYERAPLPPDPTVQIHRPLSEVLQQDWGLPADLAQNGDMAAIGKFVGLAAPWSKISSGVSGALAGATELSEATAIAKLGAEGTVDAANAKSAYDITHEILKHAGIQAVTGEVYAHLEKAPEGETPAQTETRAAQTALYGAAFSAIFDGVAHVLQSLPKGKAGTLTEEAQRTVDDVMKDVYDAFYRSGSFSSPEAARTAADRTLMAGMRKGNVPEEILDSVKRRFAANEAARTGTVQTETTEVPPPVEKPAEGTPAPTAEPIAAKPTEPTPGDVDSLGPAGKIIAPQTTPGFPSIPMARPEIDNTIPQVPPDEGAAPAAAIVDENNPPPGSASAAKIPSVPEPTTSTPVPPPTAEIVKPETPPKQVVPEELGIPAPKKQFTHNGQYVVGISEGKIVLADGSLVERAPSYIKTLGVYGYKDLKPEQIATLAGLAAAKEGAAKPEEEPPAAPIAVPPPPLAEGATPQKLSVEESGQAAEPGVQKPFIASEGAGPKLKDTREGRVKPEAPPKPVSPKSEVPPPLKGPIQIPEEPGTYTVDKSGKVKKIPLGNDLKIGKFDSGDFYIVDEKGNQLRQHGDTHGHIPVVLFKTKEEAQAEIDRRKGAVIPTVPEPGSVAKPAASTEPPPPVVKMPKAETGNPFSASLIRGEGREGSPYNPLGAQVPILGKGLYVTDNPSFAKHFGPNITSHDVEIQNPLVITDDRQWRDLTRRAGWEFPNPFGTDPQKVEGMISDLRKLIESDGHDGVVIQMNPTGDYARLLGKLFDSDQAVKFESAENGSIAASKEPETSTQLKDLEKQLETAQGLSADTSQPYDIRAEADLQAADLQDDINVLQKASKAKTSSGIPEPIASPRQESIDRYRGLTNTVATILGNGESINNPELTVLANKAFGGERGSGKYDPRDSYDAVEAAINVVISKPGFVDFNDVEGTLKRLHALESQIPRQADRTQEQIDFQQFSTPPAESFAATLGAGIRPGMKVLEPSAGTGNIATMMKLAGGEVTTNEITPRRQAILEMLGFPVYSVDAQYLDNLLPFDIIPDVVVMNPPFSSTGGRTKGHNTMYGAAHVTQALARVKPGGRVVAIVGRGMAYGRPGFNDWWEKIEGKFNVRANIGISGKHYGKFGTGFDNQILVIDKTGPTPGSTRLERINNVITGEDLSPADAAKLLGPLGKEDIAERILKHAKQPGVEKTQGTRGSRTTGLPTPPAIDIDSTRGGGQLGESAGVAGTPAGSPAVGAVERPDVPIPPVGGEGVGVRPGEGERPGAVESSATADMGGGSSNREPAGTGSDAGLTRGEINETKSESEGDVFSKYVIRKATFAGSKPHPANIVESATMSSVDPPDVSYTPKLPKALVESGKVSDVQMEAITYAGQKHGVTLSSGKHAGYWIGDGTGLGKGREVAGIFYDNYMQGKKRGVWFSATAQLKVDAKRDMDGIGLPMDLMIQQDSAMDEAIPNKDGIVFSTYSLASHKWDDGRPRLQQLVNWLGPDFDGVIAFDECFVWETAVITEIGPIPIGEIVDNRLNLKVLSWDKDSAKYEWKRIIRWLPRKLHHDLIRVTHETGSFVCTPEHKIWTEEEGYVKASAIYNHSLRLLPKTKDRTELEKQKTSPFLRHEVFGQVEDVTTGDRFKNNTDVEEDWQKASFDNNERAYGFIVENETEQSGAYARSSGTNYSEDERQDISFARRQWTSNGSSADAGRPVEPKTGVLDWPEESQRVLQVTSDTLQRGFSHTGTEDRNRSGWGQSQNEEMEVSGSAENGGPEFSRVVRVEILESGDLVRLGSRSLKNRIVYDIEVADNHNYFAAGVLVSNCHLMKNAVMANQGGQVVSQPGKQEGTNSGAMGLALDEMFPKAKIVYVSATGATVPRNMGYMSRLGLWGPGAAFPSFMDFLGAMADGGVGAMEMLSRDLKATGSYIGRSISYNGVGYDTVQHDLSPDEVANYNDLADVWSEVMQQFGHASTSAGSPKNAKGVISAYYSAQQRFFLQVQTALQLPDLFQQADKDLAEGRSVVVSLYNTNEGQVAKKVAAAKADGVDLEDLDFTPREILIDLVSKYFPVEQWTTKWDPVSQKDVQVQLVDEAGNPVINRENAAMRDTLLDKIADIRVPDNPLDAIINHFGPKNVAEITGRKKRLEGGKYVARKIKDVPLKERDAMEVKRFQDGQVHVAVISGKASAGISLHSAKGAANRDRRVFYAMQLSWSADKQMQSFGRVHRSDQAEPPILKLVLTNLKGQQRLVNTVAMRLASLGALTEGSRESKGGGLFSLQDITDEYGVAALGRTYGDIGRNRIDGITAGPQLLQRMGLLDKNGNIRDSDLANVERFLNRIMALHVDEQNAVFNHFFGLFEQVVKDAKAAGKFDEGVTKLTADNIQETSEPQLIYTDPSSGARTMLMSFAGEVQSTRMSWDELTAIHRRVSTDLPKRATGFYKNKRSGKLYSVVQSRPKEYGETDFRLYSPNAGYSNAVGPEDLAANFEAVPDGVAANEWNDQFKKVPEKVSKQFSLINGAIFPIYDKVMGAYGLKNPSVVRAELANGKSRIGILVAATEIEALKQRLGIGTPLGQASPQQIYDLAKNHSIIELDNGWEIKTGRVHGETRIEINPGQRRVNKDEMNEYGVITERIDYTNRYFVPLDDTTGPATIANIIRNHKAIRDKTAISSVEDRPTPKSAPKKAESSYYVQEPVVPAPITPPAKMGRDYKFPEQKPQSLLKPPITVGDRTYEPTVIKRTDSKGKPMSPLSGWEVAPGLAVAESPDDPTRFTITHVGSGLKLTDAASMERAITVANTMASMGDWTRSPEEMTADRPFVEKVQAEIKRSSGERGGIRLFGPKPPQKIPDRLVLSPRKNVQRPFDNPQTVSNAWQTVKELPARVKRTMVDPFIYNKDIEMWPVFAEMVRRFQGNPADAAFQAAAKIEQILHGMDNSEFQVFTKIVYLEDLYETAVVLGEDAVPIAPDPVTGRTVLQDIDEEIHRLRHYVATPAALASVDRHHVWMDEVWDDLVRRGKVEADAGRVKYYPNFIRRFGEGLDNVLGLPYRMKDPKRMYLKERKGHQQIHDSNYVRVMEQYATRVFIDNSIDDFIQAVAETYDLRTGTSKELPKLTKQDLDKLLANGMRPGQIFELPDGRQFSVYQFSPGRVMYPARVINDYVIQDALNAGMDELGIDIDRLRQALQNGQAGVPSVPQLHTVMEEPLTRHGVIMGGQHKMYLLPREISTKLTRFRDASNPTPLSELARIATKAFKVVALHSNVLSWQGQNVFSNSIMAVVEDIHILGRQKQALQLLRGKLTGPQYDTLLSLIHDARVWNSTFLGTGGSIGNAINRPGLRPYRAGVTHGASKINPFGDNPIGDFTRAYESRLQMLEAIPKVASFLENHDRIMRGMPVKHVAVNLGGLDPTSVLAVGRVARELNGDYGATHKNARPIQTLLFPFSTWYIRIVPQVVRALRHKIDPKADIGLILVASMFVATYLWNHFHHWETEKKLDWQKETLHIDTGMFDEKGNPYIWSEQTPFDAALQMGGLHTFTSNLDRAMSGEWTIEQAARKQLGDMFGFQDQAWLPTAPGAMAQQLLNPLIGVFTEMAANRDSLTGAEIVKKSNPNQWGTLSKRMPDNPVGVKLMAEYYGKRLISPYMQAMRAEQMNDPNGPIWNWITEGPLSWKKLLGIRTANLDALDMAKWYDDKNWEQSLLETHSKEIIDTYVQYEAGNIEANELEDRVIAIMQKEGPSITVGPNLTAPVPGYDVYRMMQTNAFKMQVDKALQGKVKDPKQREAIIDDMKILEDNMRMESYKGTPKSMKQIGPDGLPYVPEPPVPNQVPRTIPLVPIPAETQ